jgi:hypothetical protein
MSFKKAVKEQAKLRLAIGGIAGTGKTFSSLAIASPMSRMMRELGHGEGRIAVIDSERGSASLYADKFDFDVCEIDSFSPLAYVDKIREAEEAGYDFIIIDSLSHAWAGKDGALDQKDKAAERSSSGNSWTAWAKVTPKQNALIDAMLQSKAHVIATMRQKMKHIQTVDEKGKTKIEKVGLELVQRDQIEFEFTLCGEIDHTHTLKISKTRVDGIDLDEQFEKPGESFARKIYSWLMSGAPARPRVEPSPIVDRDVKPSNSEAAASAAGPSPVMNQLDQVFDMYLKAMANAPDLVELDRIATGPAKPERGTEKHQRATAAYIARKEWLTKQAETAKAAS